MKHRRNSASPKFNQRMVWVCSILVVCVCSSAPLYSQDTPAESQNETKQKFELSDGVFTQKGDIPIILSAPHGGLRKVPGVAERSGAGLEPGPSGFFIERDSGTEELAHEVAVAVKKRFGKEPYVVISRIHRKFMDPNRNADIAYEDPMIKPFYDAYHDTMSQYCREVTDRFQSGVLIDIHGQGTKRDTVFRGTKNGQTVSHLRNTFGEDAHRGPKSLFGLLASRGWTVHPTNPTEKEKSGFTGGFIVQSYGSQNASPIDAMQLEFGAEYRLASRRAQTALELSDALAEYASQYLRKAIDN